MYIWQLEVESIDNTTVLFKDGTTQEITERQQKYIVTEEAQDLTQTRDLVVTAVIWDIMVSLKEHNVKKSDLDAIGQAIFSTYNAMLNKAIGIAMWTYRDEQHHSENTANIAMSDIKRVIEG